MRIPCIGFAYIGRAGALAVLGGCFAGFATAQQEERSLLARGDTAGAIAALRHAVSQNPTAPQWCALATLLARTSSGANTDLARRLEAAAAFDRGLRANPDARCLYEFALLKERQGSRSDALRIVRRVDGLLRERPELRTREFLAELLYRRALLLDDWLRNFDYLVAPQQLAVSTWTCLEASYFCENFLRPRLFNERLAEAPSIAAVVSEQQYLVQRLLDSALALDPGHLEARRLRLRRSLVSQDWDDFEAVARRGVRHDPGAMLPRLALLAAQVRAGALEGAAASLREIDALLPDSLRAAFERLTVVARNPDTTRVQALWALSDPLYLTEANERRLAHYARLGLADIAFTDPTAGVRGRDTQPGRLVLRYGWPQHIWEVRRDMRLELTPSQRIVVSEILKCIDVACMLAAERASAAMSIDAGGRWTFVNYGMDLPSYVFERQLSERSYRYKLETLTRELDSAMFRAAPSTYDSPYSPAVVGGLVTRFPRPARPAVEVHARFWWDSTVLRTDSAALGVFVHDRTDGRLVSRALAGATRRRGVARFDAVVLVSWGRLQLSLEGLATGTRAAGQRREPVDFVFPAAGTLVVSDLLLGDSLQAPEVVTGREDVPFFARADSIYAPSGPVALYWEIYGLRIGPEGRRAEESPSDSVPTVRFSIRLAVRDAGGRGVGARVTRGVGELLGLRRAEDQSLEWEIERPARGALAAEVLSLTAPEQEGSYRIGITVRDLASGRTATSERVIRVHRPER